MNEEDTAFKAWLASKHPHVKLLLDEEAAIGGVNFALTITDFRNKTVIKVYPFVWAESG